MINPKRQLPADILGPVLGTVWFYGLGTHIKNQNPSNAAFFDYALSSIDLVLDDSQITQEEIPILHLGLTTLDSRVGFPYPSNLRILNQDLAERLDLPSYIPQTQFTESLQDVREEIVLANNTEKISRLGGHLFQGLSLLLLGLAAYKTFMKVLNYQFMPPNT